MYAGHLTKNLQFDLFTAHKQSLGQGNIFSSMCQEFCSQGVLPQCMLGYHPPWEQKPPRSRPPPPGSRHPPGPGTPRRRHPPGADTPQPGTPLGADTPLGPGTPLWDHASPCTVHAGRYGQQAGGMHPIGMQSC